jgi:hypothetical protein
MGTLSSRVLLSKSELALPKELAPLFEKYGMTLLGTPEGCQLLTRAEQAQNDETERMFQGE